MDDLAERPAIVGPVLALAPDRQPAAVYLAGLKPSGRRAQASGLRVVAGLLAGEAVDPAGVPWHLLRYQHVAWLRVQLGEAFAVATANRLLSAVRGVLREAWRLELMSVEDYRRAVDVGPVGGQRLPRGRALTAGELRALFHACDPTDLRGLRDGAILALLYGCGLRRTEAADAAIADVDLGRGQVRVRGKGNKERLAHLPAGALGWLTRWVEACAAEGLEGGPLLRRIVGPREARSILAEGLTGQSVYNAMKRRAKVAGVDAAACHDLRRTWVGDLLDLGVGLEVVQKLAGHADPRTTTKYDRRPEAVAAAGASRIHVPTPGGER